MVKGQQKIEIGGVCCSIDFADGFFEKEFSAVLADYKRWGFSSEGNPEISVAIREGLLPAPLKPSNSVFYHAIAYDSVFASLFIDTNSFEGRLGFSINWKDKFTPVRIVELIETFIFNAYLFYFILKDIGTFAHSCAVADGENGYLFAGSGESGKSTIGKLSAPRIVLCDDLILIRKSENGRRRVFGTPFFGDLESINRGVNCNAIYFIEKSRNNSITPISTMTAAVEFLKEGVISGFSSIDSIKNVLPYAQLFSSILSLLDGIPCFKMRFKKDNSFWELINGHEK